MNVENDEIIALAQEIERYLQAHPHAADSLEGVTRWWLGRRGHLVRQQQVLLALEYLVDKGAIKKCVTTSGTIIYSRPQPTS